MHPRLLHFDWVKGHDCKSVTIAKFVSTDLVAGEGRQGSTVQPAMASTSGEERIPLKNRKRDCRYQKEWKQCGIIRSKRGPTLLDVIHVTVTLAFKTCSNN